MELNRKDIRKEVLRMLNSLNIPYLCNGVLVGNCDACGEGGGGGNGIYGGSDYIPTGTVATAVEDFSIAFTNAGFGIEFTRKATLSYPIGDVDNFVGLYKDVDNWSGVGADTAIDGDFTRFERFDNGTSSSYYTSGPYGIQLLASQSGFSSGYSVNGSNVGFTSYNDFSGEGYSFNINPTEAQIQDATLAKLGLTYIADYSATIIPNPRSIPDVGTVKQLYTAGTGITITPTGDYMVIANSIATVTADNGLTKTANNIQLGGNLLANTTIGAGASYRLDITGSNPSDSAGAFTVYNSAQGLGARIESQGRGLVVGSENGFTGLSVISNGGAIGISTEAAGTNATGILAVADGTTTGRAVQAQSGLGTALYGVSTTGLPMHGILYPNDGLGVYPILKLERADLAAGDDGIGGSIEFHTATSSSVSYLSHRISSQWDASATGSRTSGFQIEGVDNAVEKALFRLDGNGQTRLVQYGVGTFTGTPTYALQVNSLGQIIEGAIGGGGTLTAVSVATANGFAGTSSGGATPALTLSTTITGVLKGNGAAISAATVGTDYSVGTSALATGILKSTTTTGALSIAVAGDFPTLNQNTTGSAASFTGSLSGDVTGTQSATVVGKINGTSLAGLATGILKNTTGTGVPSIAVAGDFPTLNQNTTGSAATWTTGRTIGMTGDVTWTSPSLNGSANVTAAATVTRINGTALSGLATGILKNTTGTGVPSIAVAGDFPTLNQNTTGSAATLTTARSIYGNSFNGSADLAQIIASTFGGTGNGFTKFSGPTTAEKTFTLPNASATILTTNAVVTVAQGGTNASTASITSFNNITGYTAAGATGTTSTNLVFSTSPTLVTPALGVATATRLTVAGQYASTRFALTDGPTIALDWNNGNTQSVTLGGNRSFIFANPKDGGRYLIEVIQGGGSNTLTWPTIKWSGGVAPTLTTTSGKTDLITLYYDGTSYFGSATLNH